MLPACIWQKQDQQEHSYFDFADSVAIIRGLIKSDRMATILEDVDQQKLENLLNNFSPAQIAFESEVLACTMPVLVYFYAEQPDLQAIEDLAQKYRDRIKILLIDANKFFSIAESFDIMQYSTCILINQRNEIDRITEICNKKMQEDLMHRLLLFN